MDENTTPKVLAIRDVLDVSVIDNGGTLAIHFEGANAIKTIVLVPTHVAGPLIAHLRSAEIEALKRTATSDASR